MANDDPPLTYASWLEKQAEWRFAWDPRYVTLDGLRLAYALSPDSPEKKSGHIASLQRVLSPQQPFAFRVWLDEGDCWTLRAPNATAHAEWTSALSSALDRDASAAPRDAREGAVLKKSYWTGEWRPRYAELSGCRLAYRLSRRSPVRQRYIVVAVDAGGAEGDDGDLILTTSGGERVWLRLPSAELCRTWARCAVRGVCRTAPWQWQSIGEGTAFRALRVRFHAAAVSRLDGAHVYCYGGTAEAKTGTSAGCHTDAWRGASGVWERELVRLRLHGGEPNGAVVRVLPFEESAHAKRRPPPAVGAALCVISRRGTRVATAASNGCEESLLLFGGRCGGLGSHAESVEVWWCDLGRTAPRWRVRCFSAAELPSRARHTLTPYGEGAALLVGGIDATDRARTECFIIQWPMDAKQTTMVQIEEKVKTRQEEEEEDGPSVSFFGFLPEPRAGHATALLCDGTILLFGGFGIGETAAHCVLRLAPHEAEWREMTVEPSLPPMKSVCATEGPLHAVEHSKESPRCVFVLGEVNGVVRLFQLTWTSVEGPCARVREIALLAGTVPRCCCGASMHAAWGYLVVVGSGAGNAGNVPGAASEATLPQEPVRVLIGDG